MENQLENITKHKELVENLFSRFKKLEKDIREKNEKNKRKNKEFKNKGIINEGIIFPDDNNEISDNLDYSKSVNLINLVNKKIEILKTKDSQDKKYFSNYSISLISKFCFSVYKLILKFREKLKSINEKNEGEIVDVIFDLIFLKNPR